MIDAEVVLVAMPYVGVLQPPLGVSVLCGALRANGLNVRAVYPCIDFADTIPYKLYKSYGSNVVDRFGDYFFSVAAFGTDVARENLYRKAIIEAARRGRLPGEGLCSSAEEYFDIMPRIQEQCEDLLKKWVDKIVLSPSVKVVACSASLVQLYASLAILKKVKMTRRDIVTIIGGCECEGTAGLEFVKKFDFLDYCLAGDGERSLTTVCRGCVHGPALHGVTLPEGAFDHEKALDGQIESPKMAGDSFGVIDHTDYIAAVAQSKRFKASAKLMTLEFSRGCWKGQRAHCRFCGLNGDRIAFRMKSPTRILGELRAAYARGCRVYFATDTILDLARLREPLLQFAAEAPDVAILCDAVSTLSEEQIMFLADTGVLFIQAGIESLHPRHIELMNKSNSAIGNIAYLKFAKENGIHIFWNELCCMPGDQDSEYDELATILPLLEHLEAPQFAPIRFDRFSEYWREPEKYGLDLVPYRSINYLLPSATNVDYNAVTMYFENVNKSACSNFDSPSLQKCNSLIEKWNASKGARLYASQNGIIDDTRECAVVCQYHPTELEKVLLKKLRKPVRVNEIDEFCRIMPDATCALRRLVDLKFVLLWDGAYLSLVMESICEVRKRRIDVRLESARKANLYMSKVAD